MLASQAENGIVYNLHRVADGCAGLATIITVQYESLIACFHKRSVLNVCLLSEHFGKGMTINQNPCQIIMMVACKL